MIKDNFLHKYNLDLFRQGTNEQPYYTKKNCTENCSIFPCFHQNPDRPLIPKTAWFPEW